MNKPLKLIPIGNSTGMILPKEMLARLHVDKGDQLYLTEAPDGGYRLTPFDPEFARQMELAEEIMREDREILRALAK
jgi:putative addiction module antidote